MAKKHYNRGMPEPVTFSLAALADDALLTQKEVAGVQRKSVVAIEKGRLSGADTLEWLYIDGFPRCTAGSLKKKMNSDPTVRRPPVPGHPQRGASQPRGGRQRSREAAVLR